MASVLLGERLTQLRTTLAQEAIHPAAYTRASIAHAAGVSVDALARLEKEGAGTAISLAVVLNYYQNMGVNLAWVLEPDNAEIFVRVFRDIFEDEKLPKARQPLATLHRLLQLVLSELDVVQSLMSHTVRGLLTQVQEGILHDLTHPLPPVRLVLSEADLRACQRQLPPVRAQLGGWRSAALNAAPRHYYDAGGSLPRCGDPVSYLAYDPGPQMGSDATQCSACHDRVGAPLPPTPPARANPRTRRAAPVDLDDIDSHSLRFLCQG